jgi:hypothetical protein
VCSCPITDYRGLRLDANELWLHFLKKTSVAAINITLGVPGQRADKNESTLYSTATLAEMNSTVAACTVTSLENGWSHVTSWIEESKFESGYSIAAK